MKNVWLAVLACPVFLAAGAPLVAQGPHANNVKAFNGTSLDGWQPQGSADWRVAHGEIVGTASGTPGWLALDRRYQDVIVRFSYQCTGCEAGVVLRRETVASPAPGTTKGLYVGLAGNDALTLQRIAWDAHGKEVSRDALYKWSGRQNPQGLQLRVIEGASGWKDVFIQLRGDVSAPAAPKPASAPPPNVVATYGQFALQIRSGEVKVRGVVVTDLLRPSAGVAEEVTAPGFRRILLTDHYYSEGISAGDVNRDGHMDALSGPYAYLGPDFTRAVEIYQPQIYARARENLSGLFTDNWASYVHDFTGDGWPDYLKISIFTSNGQVPPAAWLYVNPKGESHHWASYQVSPSDLSSETTWFGDLDGDGKPELVMSRGRDAERVIGYLKPGLDATKPWTWIGVSDKARALDYHGHGYGAGDVNSDGKMDILHGNGWWEQPAAGAASGPWTFHAATFGHGPDPWIRGADIATYDVNADGLPDVITSLFAHGPGLAWYEQQKQGEKIAWKEHVIFDDPQVPATAKETWETTDRKLTFTDMHAVAYADIDGDGVTDIITGKKWFSHGVVYSENDRDDPGLLVWFKTRRKAHTHQVEFVPQIINNYVGMGSQLAVADMNKDGRPDVLTASRRGAYIFLNLK